MIRKRMPVVLGRGLKSVPVDWKGLLKNNEQSFLTDNQLSVFFDPKGPGCDRTHFYPLPFPHRFTGDKWDHPELVNHDSLRSVGPKLAFTPAKTSLEFLPHVLKKTMTGGKAKIVERDCVSGNVLLIEWTFTGLSEAELTFGLPYFNGKISPISNGRLASIKDQAFAALAVAGAKAVEYETKDSPIEIKGKIYPAKGKKTFLAYACGYDARTVTREIQRALKNPERVFQAAETMWGDYFEKIVPHFSCSNRSLQRLYYYQAYVTRANMYDIPYEPFTQPYTCPWKTGAVWQWSWNTPMDSVAERWLNDKQIGAGGILLEGDNGGGLNIGTWLRPVKKVTQYRSHNESMKKMGELLKKLPKRLDPLPFTVIPHTTPNGLLGAWEFYLCSGDKQFLARAFEIMREAEWEFSRHELPSGLCATRFVDEFDYSLRLKPFIRAFKKGDTKMMLKMDTPFIAIDYNCYLVVLREKMIEAAELLKVKFDTGKLRRKNDKLKAAIRRYCWNDRAGFYFDVDPRTMKTSNVKCLQALATMYAGIATPNEARRMVEHLTNPKEFGTPWPCPSVAMDTPGVDPSLITYGGDVEITSGLYFTVEGLVRYGYTKLAAEYLAKAIRMVTLDGPSSSYSYHCLTGKYNMDKHTLAAQCEILTDLICKYIIGLRPLPGGKFELEPLALAAAGIKNFRFGPYRYCDKPVTVAYDAKKGFTVT